MMLRRRESLTVLFTTALVLHAQDVQTIRSKRPIRASGGRFTSVYSSLDEKACKTLQSPINESSSVQLCPGTAGYQLKVLDEDSRMSVTVVGPDGREYALRYPEVVTPYFSSVGPRAEWRMTTGAGALKPVALTVRLNVNEDSAAPGKVTSYLVVSRLDGARTCAVRVVKSSASALDEARSVADHARELECLKPR